MVTRVGFRPKAASRIALGVGAALGLLILSGCAADEVLHDVNPVNWYKGLTGSDKGTPPADAPNTANLESGSNGDYPNLASVPKEPVRGLTDEQKEALTQGLIADREHAHYTDEAQRAGNAAAVMPAQVAIPAEQTPSALPPVAPAPSAVPAVAPKTQPAPASPGAAPPPPSAPVAATRESSLTPPTPRSLPTPETPNAPPASPDLKPLPPPTPEAPVPGAPAAHPAPPPGPSEIAGVAVPTAPPVRPETAPATAAMPPVPTPAAAPPTPKLSHSTEIGELAFAGSSNDLPGNASTILAKVPPLHQQYGGIVRVVTYTITPQTGADPAGQQLKAYQAAVGRAESVKQALIKAGIPATSIVTQASPVQSAGPALDRADIFVEY